MNKHKAAMHNREIERELHNDSWGEHVRRYHEEGDRSAFVWVRREVVATPKSTNPAQCWSEEIFSEVSL